MPQLVGMKCVACGKTVASIVEGRFCRCGNPVHNKCSNKVASTAESNDRCPECGGDAENPDAKRIQFERSRPPDQVDPLELPQGKICPACGDARFERVRPKRLVQFALDRKCLACGTRYSAVVPAWGVAVLIIVGLILLGMGVVGGLASLATVDVCSILLSAFLMILGGGAVVEGIRGAIRRN